MFEKGKSNESKGGSGGLTQSRQADTSIKHFRAIPQVGGCLPPLSIPQRQQTNKRRHHGHPQQHIAPMMQPEVVGESNAGSQEIVDKTTSNHNLKFTFSKSET